MLYVGSGFMKGKRALTFCPSNPVYLYLLIASPARRLGLSLDDWILTRDIWVKNARLVNQRDFFQFVRWANETELIVSKPWKGSWAQIKLTAKGKEVLATLQV